MHRVNRQLVQDRLNWAGELKQLPGTVEAWNAAKAERDISSSAPHVQRFALHLGVIRAWAENYPAFDFRVVTDLRAYTDVLVESQEPELWAAKKAKKTWDGIYPDRFKISDVDINIYLQGKTLSLREIGLLFYSDALRHPKCSNIFDFPNFRLDIYPDKGEPGQWLNEYLV